MINVCMHIIKRAHTHTQEPPHSQHTHPYSSQGPHTAEALHPKADKKPYYTLRPDQKILTSRDSISSSKHHPPPPPNSACAGIGVTKPKVRNMTKRRGTVTTTVLTKHGLGHPAMTPSKIFEVGSRSSISILGLGF